MKVEAGQIQALVNLCNSFHCNLYQSPHINPLLTWNFMHCFLIYLKQYKLKFCVSNSFPVITRRPQA